MHLGTENSFASNLRHFDRDSGIKYPLPEMPQVCFVSDEHDDYVAVGEVPQLLQPLFCVLEGLVVGDVINKQCAHRAAVITKTSIPKEY